MPSEANRDRIELSNQVLTTANKLSKNLYLNNK